MFDTDFDSSFGTTADMARLADPVEPVPTTYVGDVPRAIKWIEQHGFPCRQDGDGGPVVIEIPYHDRAGSGVQPYVCGNLQDVRAALGY